MIAHLKGKVLKITNKGIILDTGNIGYFAYITKSLLPEVKEGKEIEVFTHNQIREDASDLYGFATFEELTFFKTLINVKGIGPKVALELLSTDPEKIKTAIIAEDATFIAKTPGIGKKTAQRLILELKGEITTKNLDRDYKNITPDKQSDVEAALIRLGYKRREISQTLADLPSDVKEVEDIISYFLKNA